MLKVNHTARFFFLLCVFSTYSGWAIESETDSLKRQMAVAGNDTERVWIYHQLYQISDSLVYAKEGLELAKRINHQKGISQLLLDAGRWYYFDGKEDISMNYLIQSIRIAERAKHNEILKSAYRYIGFIYRPREPFKAREYYEKSLKICLETGDELAASYIYSAIGNIYEGISQAISDSAKGNNEKALKYYLMSLKIREDIGSDSEIASSLNETSRMYNQLGLFAKSLELKLRGLGIAEKSGDIPNIIYLCNLLGNDYAGQYKDHNTSIKYQLRAFELGKVNSKNYELLYDICNSLALSYSALGQYKSADEFFIKGVIYNDSLRSRATKYDYNLSAIKQGLENELEKQKLLLKDAEILKGKVAAENLTIIRNSFIIGFILLMVFAAFVYYAYRQKQQSNRSLVISESNFKQITETISDVFYLYNIVEKKYEYVSPNCTELLGLTPDYFYTGKSTKAIVHPEDLPLVVEANVKIDKGIPYDIEYRILLNGQIRWFAEKSSPIYDVQGKLIRNSGICRDITLRKSNEDLIRKKSKDITDSILYARTIQSAILVPKEKIGLRLKEFFIFSRPKDIVGGDFYFFKETKKGFFLAAADCTGHGVPAGFMSMVGTAFLNEIVEGEESLKPGEVLDKLRLRVIHAFNQHAAKAENTDGLDIGLMFLKKDLTEVQFAGAFNSLLVLRKGQFREIKADLFPVGMSLERKLVSFTTSFEKLEKGDQLYIYTDGYTDQFGGPQDRKFLKKQFLELITANETLSMEEQEKAIIYAHENWKGDKDQVDDILVIGVRV